MRQWCPHCGILLEKNGDGELYCPDENCRGARQEEVKDVEKLSVRARINRRIREQQEQPKRESMDSEDEDEEQDRDEYEETAEEELRDEYEELCEEFDSEEDMSYEDRQRWMKLAGLFAGEDDGGEEAV